MQCGASAAAATAAAPTVPGFRITRVLGRGGAAVVYEAWQESLDRYVAVKVLRDDVEDRAVWRAFQREAKTIARLSGHPHVLTVYDAGRTSLGQPYLVTEFLDEGSLADVITSEGPVPLDRVVTTGVAVADALVAVHALGIHHRDVKPENVLLGSDGRIKLGDFGIARLLAGRTSATTDVVAFTPEHVAPEILRGEPDGTWSDVYGLASTLVTATVGYPLFKRGRGESVAAMLSRKSTAVRPLMPDSVPPLLAGVLAPALDRQPAQRPTLDEFRRQLIEAGEGIRSARADPPPTLQQPAGAAVLAAPTVVAAGILSPTDRWTAPAGTDGHDPPSMIDDIRRRRRRRRLLVPLSALATVLVFGVVASTIDDGRIGGASTAPTVGPTTGASTSAPATSPPPASTSTTPTTVPAPVAVPEQPATSATNAPQTSTVLTTAPPSPTAAPATTMRPPPAAPVGGTSTIRAQEAEAFLRGYYDSVDRGDYDVSWSQLTPQFQRGKARSYEYYVSFWEHNDIEVGTVQLIDANDRGAVVQAELRWNGGTTAIRDQFTLVRDDQGALVISKQEAVDR